MTSDRNHCYFFFFARYRKFCSRGIKQAEFRNFICNSFPEFTLFGLFFNILVVRENSNNFFQHFLLPHLLFEMRDFTKTVKKKKKTGEEKMVKTIRTLFCATSPECYNP